MQHPCSSGQNVKEPLIPSENDNFDPVVLQRRFREFGGLAGIGYDSLYGRLCSLISEDPQILALLEAAPGMHQRPVQLLACIHHQVLLEDQLGRAGKPVSGLLSWYPTVGGRADHAGDLAGALKNFCETHREAMLSLMRRRTVQTNEIGRASFLRPALAWCRQQLKLKPDQPMHWLEIGASAGLNLHLQGFEISYDGQPMRGGSSEDGIRQCKVDCQLRDDAVPAASAVMQAAHLPWQIAPIGRRAGLDIAPIDVFNFDDARWLRACIFADNPERLARLDSALEIARQDPVALLSGDVNLVLEQAVSAFALNGPLCISHSWVTTYLPKDEREWFAEKLLRLAKENPDRPIAWIGCEMWSALPIRSEAMSQSVARFALDNDKTAPTLIAASPDLARAEASLLAVAHPHGAWMQWFGA